MQIRKALRIAITLAILGFVILIHEFGHFTTCKLFNIATPTFSIGFGPPLVQKQIGNTTFQIAMLPFGGYVSMNAAQLQQAPYWQKMIITLAGIFNNFLLALMLLGLLFYLNCTRFKPIIKKIVRGSPAAQAGLQIGDHITQINDTPIGDNADLLLQTIQAKPKQTITCTIERARMVYNISADLDARTIAGSTIGYLGIILAKDYTKKTSLVEILRQAITTVWYMIKKSFRFLTTFFKPETRKRFAKPIGITSLTSQSLQQGSNVMLFFIASISIELGVFNIMPIPLLDGGQAVYYTLEALLGHALTSEELTIINFLYLMLLIALGLYLNRKARKATQH